MTERYAFSVLLSAFLLCAFTSFALALPTYKTRKYDFSGYSIDQW